ncbi:MAG TPA: ABC transporter permease [Phycisphaerae bacterium]|nr:ABC transporter permease [Phycisphaerae bacterium]
MNLIQLILKQMRVRLLSSLLTCLSVVLAVALATSVLVVGREGRSVFAQTDYGYDLIVGPKGSGVSLVLNTIYHVGVSQGNVPYALYEDMSSNSEMSAEHPGERNPYRGLVQWAVPYAVGDSYKGRRIVGTTAQLFGVTDTGEALPADKVPEYRGGERYTFAQGRAFDGRKFEAVIGWNTARGTGLKVGDTFHATHGFPGPNDIPDVHPETWRVVGILNQTHTANDDVLFIPLRTFYAIFEHETGLERIGEIRGGTSGTSSQESVVRSQKREASSQESVVSSQKGEAVHEGYTLNGDGTIDNKLPEGEWEVSAILVKSRSAATGLQLDFLLRNLPEASGVRPAMVMNAFFEQFLSGVLEVLTLVAALVMVVAGVSILVSIYNSVAARMREIAILRALGATRLRIVAAVCLEAGFVALMGGVIGVILGHLLAAGGSAYLRTILGSGIAWWRVQPEELLYLAVATVLGLVAGLAPALKAYRTPVAENLVG